MNCENFIWIFSVEGCKLEANQITLPFWQNGTKIDPRHFLYDFNFKKFVKHVDSVQM